MFEGSLRWRLRDAVEDLELSLGGAAQGLASPSSEHDVFLGLAHRLRMQQPEVVAILIEVHSALGGMPLGSGALDDTQLRAIEDRLDFAVRSGLLRVLRIPPPDGFHPPTDVLPPADDAGPPPPEQAPELLTWFQLTVVDEVGDPVSGLDLTFSVDGSERKVPTSGAGIAEVKNARLSSAQVRLTNVQKARDAMKERWRTLREGDLPEEGPDVRIEALREGMPTIPLRGEKPFTLVLTRLNYRVRMLGMFFDTSKSFLLPPAMNGMREVVRLYTAHPDSEMLVVGHTDTEGQEAYNETLSLERAAAVAAFLTDDVDAWMEWFDDGKPDEKRWGYREIQWMLSALPDGERPYYDARPSGTLDNRTRAAIRRFQEDGGLPPTGSADDGTRRAIVTDYMALDRTSLPEGIPLTTHGCGEYFPAEETADGVASAENRRVEIFFFDGVIAPEPAGEISARGATDYPRWLQSLLETIDFTRAGSDRHLASRFPMDVYEKMAASLPEHEFVAWSSLVFGSDIPIDAYQKLHAKLLDKSLPPPPIRLQIGAGAAANYDNETREVVVEENLPLRAETDNDAAETLFIALLHEFGHHIDNVLRTELSRAGGDAKDDEGALFAYAAVGQTHPETDTTVFAYHYRLGHEIELKLQYPEFHQAVQDYLSDDAKRQEAKKNNVEFFGAGRGVHPGIDFGHQSIEDGLQDADKLFFDDDVRKLIYFGNWLRDFSQFIDPAWERYFVNRFFNATKQARKFMTHLLDLAAKSEFDAASAPSARNPAFVVDTKRLGLYRNHEHIDNPKGLGDARFIDPDFRGPIGPDELGIDAGLGMKKYIRTPGPYTTSTEFIERSFRASAATFAADRTEAFRLFGQGLHTLEDYYAHSNFVELSLIRLGHTNVFAWVGPRARVTVTRNGKPETWIPLVTGTFGGADTVVSAGSAIGESLEKDIECKAGDFSAGSVELIELLQAVTPDGGKAAESLFTELHELEKKYPKLANLMCDVQRIPKEWIRAKIGAAMREQVLRVQAAEAEFFADPTSHDPTHSMLSKDHNDHPLHVIAAQCAKRAVQRVGTLMRDAWRGTRPVDDVVKAAFGYLIHPNDISLVSSTLPGELLMMIDAFARSSPAAVAQLDTVSSINRFLREARKQRKEALEKARDLYGGDDENANRIQNLTPAR